MKTQTTQRNEQWRKWHL